MKQTLDAFSSFSGLLCDTLIDRTTKVGHAVQCLDRDLGFGCLGFHFAAA